MFIRLLKSSLRAIPKFRGLPLNYNRHKNDTSLTFGVEGIVSQMLIQSPFKILLKCYLLPDQSRYKKSASRRELYYNAMQTT